jgi:hypothetical protein
MILKTDIRIYRENGCSMPYSVFDLQNTRTLDRLNKALIFQGFRQYNATSDDLKIENMMTEKPSFFKAFKDFGIAWVQEYNGISVNLLSYIFSNGTFVFEFGKYSGGKDDGVVYIQYFLNFPKI